MIYICIIILLAVWTEFGSIENVNCNTINEIEFVGVCA